MVVVDVVVVLHVAVVVVGGGVVGVVVGVSAVLELCFVCVFFVGYSCGMQQQQ